MATKTQPGLSWKTVTPPRVSPRIIEKTANTRFRVGWWTAVAAALVLLMARQNTGTPLIAAAIGAAGLYVIVLIWYLVRTSPHPTNITHRAPLLFPWAGFWGMFLILGTGLLFGPALISLGISKLGIYLVDYESMIRWMAYWQPWVIFEVVLAAAGLFIMLAWRHLISWWMVLLGIAAGVTALLAQGMVAARSSTDYALFWAVLQGLSIPLTFIAGSILVRHCRIGQMRLLKGRYNRALRGFVWGMGFIFPLILLKLAAEPLPNISYLNNMWEAAAFAWLPTIAEGTWARLFLLPLCYALLKPHTCDRPGRAVTGAVLLSTMAHALVYGLSIEMLLITGCIYLLPMAILFVRRDWEHALGAHYALNLIPLLLMLA